MIRSEKYLMCILVLFFFYFIVVRSIPVSKSGPYISNIFKVEKCKEPSPPYFKELTVDVSVEVYNASKKTLLRGNFSTVKPQTNLKVTIQDYFLVNGDWQPTFHIGEMSCRGRLVAMMGQIFDIKFDKKTCTVPKGVYVFSNIDYDFVDHIFLLSREYGRVLRKVTVANKMGTSVCLEFHSVVTAKTE